MCLKGPGDKRLKMSDFDDLRQMREAKEKAEESKHLRKLEEGRRQSEAADAELIARAHSLHETVVSVLEDFRKAVFPNKQWVVTPQVAPLFFAGPSVKGYRTSISRWTIQEPDSSSDWPAYVAIAVVLQHDPESEQLHFVVTGSKSVTCSPTPHDLVQALKELYLAANDERKA